MSKDLELESILPNGRHHSNSPSKMSGSGSFTTPSPHDVSTDIVSSVPPVYSTVPDAQAAHNRYTAKQIKPTDPAPQMEYTSPVGMDPPNTYDIIPENGKRRERSHSPGRVPLMADNILYGTPADEQFKHRTLTMEKAAAEAQQEFNQRRFTGSTSSHLVKEPSDKDSSCSGKCCGVCLMLVLVFVVAILAVAALVLVLSIMFRVYPVCDCTAGSLTDSQEFRELQLMVDRLMTELQAQTPQPSELASTQELINNVSSLRNEVEALTNTRVNSSLLAGRTYSSVLHNLNLFENCTTEIEGSCTVVAPTQTSAYPLPCETYDTPLDVSGKFNLDMRCIRPSIPNDTSNALVATLDITDNFVRCLCHVVVDDTNDRLQHNVDCALQMTRCSIPRDISAEFTVVASP